MLKTKQWQRQNEHRVLSARSYIGQRYQVWQHWSPLEGRLCTLIGWGEVPPANRVKAWDHVTPTEDPPYNASWQFMV
jgi:hypothetical protein